MDSGEKTMQSLLSYIDDDLDTLIEIGRLILTEFPEVMAELKSHLDSKDVQNCKRNLHRLRGSLKILHNFNTIEIIQSMDDLIGQEEFQQAQEEFHILTEHIKKITDDIGKMIADQSKEK